MKLIVFLALLLVSGISANATGSALSNRPGITLPNLDTLSCGDIVGAGWNNMPDITYYVLAQPGSNKLGYRSECHIESLVFSQCWLEPRWSVKKAIDVLLHKAANGKKLPDTPMCGA